MKKIVFKFVLILSLIVFGAAPLYAANYSVDIDHSSVSFKIRHLLSNVQGFFREFDGTVEYEPGKPASWKAQGSIKTASIDTNAEKRDTHLKSADFFEVEKYPAIDFKTTRVLESSADKAKVEGLLKMHGVEKLIVLEVQINGVAKDPWGNTRASFTVTGLLNRKDFGLGFTKVLETGEVLVGDEVKLDLEIEAILKE